MKSEPLLNNRYSSIFPFVGNEISETERKLQINIQKILAEKSLNQKDLAIGIGVPTASINDLLSPKGKMRFKIHTLEKIATFFNVTIPDLIYGSTPEPKYPPELQELIDYYLNIPTFRKGVDWFLVDIYAKCKRDIEEYKKGLAGDNSPSR